MAGHRYNHWNNYGLIAGLVIGIYLLTRKDDRQETLDVVNESAPRLSPTKPASWYVTKADAIYNMALGPTSSSTKDSIASIIYELKSSSDWYSLDAAFGVRDFFGWGTGEGSLIDFLRDELDNTTHWEKIKGMLAIWGIPIR